MQTCLPWSWAVLCLAVAGTAEASPASSQPLDAIVTVIDGDNRPATTPGPGRRKGGIVALDVNFRSLFVSFPVAPFLSSITLKCNPAVAEVPIDNTTMDAESLELYSSNDNRTFVKHDFRFSAPDKTTIILDGFQIKAKFLKIHTTRDESHDYRFINDLSRMTPTWVRPRSKRPTRIVMDQAWQPGMIPGKTPEISLKVLTDVPDQERADGTLVVRLVSDATGRLAADREVPGPPPVKEMRFSTEPLDWGAYTVHTSFRNGDGKELAGGQDAAIVLPGGKQQVKILNNLVTELANLRGRGVQGQETIAFMNPRRGWCFFSVQGDGAVRLNDERKRLTGGKEDGRERESMRFLPAGRHTLHVEGRPSNVVVRAIPILQYVGYNNEPYITAHGPYDWAFLKHDVLANINVMISHGHQEHLPELEAWKQSGRSWIAMMPNPFRGRQDVSADEAYHLWSRGLGLNHPLMDGVIVDEFGGGDQVKYDGFREAVERIKSNPRFKGKTFSPYTYGSGILSNGKSRKFGLASIESGGHICLERYLWEEPTLEAAQRNIHKRLLTGWNMPRFEELVPGITRRCVMVLGYISAPTESLNIDPGVDFKVYMDMQMRVLATDPSFFGLGGVQQYLAAYSDEENIRWAGHLFRHYCIDGNTDPATNDPYVLDHVRNPDFADGTADWEITPAESGSIAAKELAGYGAFQFRYPAPPAPVMGDTFLWTKRSAGKPNIFSQQIRGLEPGRLYSLKMATGDYQDLVGEIQDRKRHGVSITIENADVLSGNKEAFQFIFGNHPSHRYGKFHHLASYGGNYTYWMNYHWQVFRAQATTARLTVSDWDQQGDPGDHIGQELMYNFIEVQPYYRR